MIRGIAAHVPPLIMQIIYILTLSIGASAMAWGPPFRIGLIPCRKVLRHADSKDFSGARGGGAIRIPYVGEGSPCPSILIFEVGAGAKETTNNIGVSKSEGNVERAPKRLSDAEN